MKLPAHVEYCIQTLEEAGFAAYAVGGCVRDFLLGLEPQDFDLCTAATPEKLQELFSDHSQVLAGVKHGTVGIVFHQEVVEITTFRAEGDYSDGRHPDWVAFVEDITSDLARRDFTVNAMAWSPSRGLVDPFGGEKDLKDRVLRAVGDPEQRFREDALRILRGARFAARYGLTPEAATLDAMLTLTPLMEELARERVFSELSKLLLHANAQQLLLFEPIITQVIPELKPAVGMDQHSVHHAFDLYTHIAHVVQAVPQELSLRWAALLHDVCKPAVFTLDDQGHGHFYDHAQVGGQLTEEILRRLKAPTALREQVTHLVQLHMHRFEPERRTLRRWASRLGFDTLYRLLTLQEGDMGSKGKPEDGFYFTQIRELIRELEQEAACLTLKDLAISGTDLLELGFPAGKELGDCLQQLLELVIAEVLPNDPQALAEEAAKLLPQ